MYVFMYVCIYIYIYTYICVHICIYIYIYIIYLADPADRHIIDFVSAVGNGTARNLELDETAPFVRRGKKERNRTFCSFLPVPNPSRFIKGGCSGNRV